ncbi:hypothetical protein ACJX0J_018469, partial [Zea mays]
RGMPMVKELLELWEEGVACLAKWHKDILSMAHMGHLRYLNKIVQKDWNLEGLPRRNSMYIWIALGTRTHGRNMEKCEHLIKHMVKGFFLARIQQIYIIEAREIKTRTSLRK